jgi:hypothetical protein
MVGIGRSIYQTCPLNLPEGIGDGVRSRDGSTIVGNTIDPSFLAGQPLSK